MANPVPKPSYKRFKPTAKQRGNISPSVSQKVHERAGGRCERCGWALGTFDPTGKRMGLQRAHLVRRWKLERTTEHDIALLCGPSVNSGTCHHWIDYTAEGREWAESYRKKLMEGQI